MENHYAISLEGAHSGGAALRRMRAAVGRAKRTMGGDWLLSGIALDTSGAKVRFCFRLKSSPRVETRG